MMDHQNETSEGRKRSISSPEKAIASPSKKAKYESNDKPQPSPLKQACSDHMSEVKLLQDTTFLDASGGTMNSETQNLESELRVKENKIKTKDSLADNRQEKTVPSEGKTEKKKGRLRKKAVLKAVLEQMEFYFSDCNLSKDRYLRKLYDGCKDGFVDLTVFGNFNKLQSLHKDGVSLSLLRKALEKSAFLQLNEDGTKVKRRTPLKVLTVGETNKRTVYVEYLPRHANHAWIQNIFSQCGTVCYVSLPVFRTTKQIKGFAFVEFQSPEEAEKACQMLNNPPPAKVEEKPGKFPKGNKQLKSLQKFLPIKTEEEENEETTTKSELKEDPDVLSAACKKKKKKKSKKRRLSETGSEEGSGKKENKQVEVKEGKKKKKKKKKKQTASSESQPMLEEESSVKGEKVIQESSHGLGEKEKCDEAINKGKESELCGDINKDGVETEVPIQEQDDAIIKKKRKRKRSKKRDDEASDKNSSNEKINLSNTNIGKENNEPKDPPVKDQVDIKATAQATIVSAPLSARKERKRLRQEDIRKKKEQNKESEENSMENKPDIDVTDSDSATPLPKPVCLKRIRGSDISEGSMVEVPSKVRRKSDGSELTSCLVKSKKQPVQKKVEFNPVPITTEFIKRKEVRRRKKVKRDSLHLRVITKKDWLLLKAEYISKQKSHMATLKNSLRELRQQEEQNRSREENEGKKHVDLTDVFGTKRLKPSMDVKLAHLEELKPIPNVIVQWKCSHEMPREKIRTMFKEIGGDSIAYIEAQEEAKSGYIRFKDETSAEEFAKLSRSSDSFSARVLPESQQASYWEKANRDRAAKLSRKKHERGSEKIARKVFERNKATFQQKPSHVVFENSDHEDEADNIKEVLDASIKIKEEDKSLSPVNVD